MNQARISGMIYALKIVEEKGIDGLRDEIKLRNITHVPITVRKETVEKCMKDAADMAVDAVLILSIMTLKDEFNFGTVRLQRFIDRFNSKAEFIADGTVTWLDNVEAIRTENGININADHLLRNQLKKERGEINYED